MSYASNTSQPERKNNMLKVENIKKLHEHGEMWANDSYSKKYLEKYLADYEKASAMSLEELYAKINKKNIVK